MEFNIIFKYGGDPTASKFSKLSNYRWSGDEKRLIKYIMNKEKRTDLDIYGSINMIETSPKKMALEMEKVKSVFEKKGGYLIRHMSVSFGDEPFQNFSRKTFVKKFERVLKCFDGIQAVYALHENTDIKHIHIVFNTVSIYGHKLNFNKKALKEFLKQLELAFGESYSETAKIPVVLYC